MSKPSSRVATACGDAARDPGGTFRPALLAPPGERARGRTWYEETFLPKIGPWALYGLLFTIVLLFALQGEQVTSRPLDVARIALPLLVYFGLMWFAGLLLGKGLGLGYARSTTLAFTAAGNNFELAIAVAIGVFGIGSGVAFATVVGPLLEVPVLISLVNVALRLRARWYGGAVEAHCPAPHEGLP